MYTQVDLERLGLSFLLENNSDFIAVTDLDGQILHINRTGQQLIGLPTLSNAQNIEMDDFLTADSREMMRDLIFPSLQQEGKWSGEVYLKNIRTEAPIPVWWNMFTLYNSLESAQPVAYACVSLTLTQGIPSFPMQLYPHSFIQAITQNLAEGVYAIDKTGKITFTNPAAEKMLGWPSGSLLGQVAHEVIHYQRGDGSSYPAHECPLIAVAQSGNILHSHEDSFIRSDGTHFPVFCTSSPIINDGKPDGAVMTFHDISERLKTEERIKQTKAEMENANFLLNSITRVQASFIAGIDQWTLWDNFVQDILALTESQYGYIGEVFYKESREPYLVFRGLTNIAWNQETQVLFEGLRTRGLEFHNLDNLYGIGLKDGGRTVISNDPDNDPRKGGLPQGHPSLNSYMALPIYGNNGILIGQIGLANRPGGFDERLEDYLRPLIVTCSYIIEAYRQQNFRKSADQDRKDQYDLTKTITENATAALLMVNNKGYCTFMNPAAEKMTGYTFEEMSSQPMHNLIHHSHPDGTPFPVEECPIDRALPERNQIRAHEEIFVRKNGTFFPGLCAAEPIYKDGIPVGTVVEIRDITEEKRAQQCILESEERFRTMADCAPVMIWLSDSDGAIAYINKTWRDFTGREILQDIGHGWQEVIHPDDLKATNVAYMTAFQERKNFEIECRLQRHDGEYRWIMTTGTPRFTPSGEFTGYIGSCIDITERRQAKEELEGLVSERTSQLQATNRELEAFCYSVSHDLRAPLRSIDGFSQALLEDYSHVLDEFGQDYLARVRKETQRMGQLIDDMLNLSRLTRSEMQQASVDLSAIATEIAQTLQAQEPGRYVRIDVEPGLIALGDARLLYIALQNLMSNAWKFTSHHATAHIEFGHKQEYDRSIYFVRDDGAGFEMAYASKLFGVFQRLHAMEEFSGTGIGLATVQRIIQRHNGHVWAEGEVEKGSTFYFTLNESKL